MKTIFTEINFFAIVTTNIGLCVYKTALQFALEQSDISIEFKQQVPKGIMVIFFVLVMQ